MRRKDQELIEPCYYDKGLSVDEETLPNPHNYQSITNSMTNDDKQVPNQLIPTCYYDYDRSNIFLPKDDKEWVYVDQWKPKEEDIIYKSCKGSVYIPVADMYNIKGPDASILNYFNLTPKRCYTGKNMKDHLPLYMNYFERFYDRERELYSYTSIIKYMIDYIKEYSEEAFIADIERYILCPSLRNKAHMMNNDNYMLDLDSRKYKSEKNPSLIYRDRHAKLLMWMSLLMNMCIPLLTHYAYVHKKLNTNEFLLNVYDRILHLTDIDVYNKLYETCYSNIYRSTIKNKTLWDIQDIRGNNITTQTLIAVQNILLNIFPKYKYDKNCIYLNYVSIRKNNGYQVEDIRYEYNYISLSNAKKDAENNSVFDKFESYLIKQNDLLYLLNQTSATETVKQIESMYGPFSNSEIDFYIRRLEDDQGNIINNFQKTLIFYLFDKYFGDPKCAYSINKIDYVKLMIAAFRQLEANNMVVLPYIISSRVEKIVSRKSINKKELERLQSSRYYDMVKNKYNNDKKIETIILSMIATILSSEFRIIDYHNPNLDGKIIDKKDIPEYIGEEVLMYINLI